MTQLDSKLPQKHVSKVKSTIGALDGAVRYHPMSGQGGFHGYISSTSSNESVRLWMKKIHARRRRLVYPSIHRVSVIQLVQDIVHPQY